ncbi:TRAP transporter substrate-binding protein [Lichenibacterium ramalinae]|uniref:TRAP transporter substrate-binding protein n=1 Tax=Lichenibacterium ramalinae TaxID=2316527 RepID=A0A4Q2RJW0_9HYPH|nr:TRAP transporter substrate-binding protein [Lichenibacterium ramalinae]RYB07842.1 TRAP transporter substrate-binding protein [Lichenibacterium ramalinae]
MTGRLRFLGATASCALLLLGAGAASAETVLRLGHASSAGSLVDQAVLRFADAVKAETKGGVTVQDFPAGQLGDEGPIAEGVGSGAIDIGLGGVVDGIDPKLNVLALPFLFKDLADAHAVLDGPAGQTLKALGQDRGFRLLGFLDSGFRDFADSKRPIAVPADLVGLKLRTPPIPVILDTLKALGALPQAIPFGQVYTSLQSHVVDGVEPELRDYQDQKWFEVAKYLSISNYIWTANVWYMNKERYDGLTAAERGAVDKAAADTVAWYRGQLDATYARVLSELKAKGVVVNTVDPAPFKAAVAPVYAHYQQVWGKPFVDAVVAAAAKPAP